MQSNRLPSILIVDDTPLNLDLIAGILDKEYQIFIATNGQRAIDICNEKTPDLILLDIVMPEMDGYQVCQQLKSNPNTKEIPIIFITASDHEEDEIKGFNLGAVDYITKPVKPAILLQRVRTHIDLVLAKTTLLNEREMIEDIIYKMRSDLHYVETNIRRLDCSVEKTSGDILLSAFGPKNHQYILLGDFTGHGLPAAIGGPIAAYIFYRMIEMEYPFKDIINELNNVLYRMLPSYVFMAFTGIIIEPDRQSLQLWNAGLPASVMINEKGEIQTFKSSLPPLGVLDDINIDDGYVIDLSEKDRLFIFSDGLLEASNANDEMFGEDNLYPLLQGIVIDDNSLESILDAVKNHQSSKELEDDVTLIEIRS